MSMSRVEQILEYALGRASSLPTRLSRAEGLLVELIQEIESIEQQEIITIGGRVDTFADLPASADPGTLYFVGAVSDADKAEYVMTSGGTWEMFGYSTLVVDDSLSPFSHNPVQNAVITNAMVGKKASNGGEAFNGITPMDSGDNANVGAYAHIEGYMTLATGGLSHAEGNGTRATANFAHAEGEGTLASGIASHAEGSGSTASGYHSHVEGTSATASGANSHAEGTGTTASNEETHAEGLATTASGIASHTEGNGTRASGKCSHAEGDSTLASGVASHASGFNTIAASGYQYTIGKFNRSEANGVYAFIIGNGTSNNSRSNAFAIDWYGNIFVGNTSTGINVETLANTVSSNYTALNSGLNTLANTLSQLYNELNDGKVDKVTGKQLSTEDYSTAEKTKLNNCKTIWTGTAAEYAQLQTDDYDLYFIEEVSNS